MRNIRNIALVNCCEDLEGLAEGTYVLDSQGGLMVRGAYDTCEKVYFSLGIMRWPSRRPE